MTAIAYYLLKMLICSGILTGYYYACLQNKLFHQWNRFYLLFTVIVSMVFPLLYIPLFDFSSHTNAVENIAYTITASELALLKQQHSSFSTAELATCSIYGGVTIFFLMVFVISLYRINRLKKRSAFIQESAINIYQTNAPQAPFSFFKNIFWKQNIDLQSADGKRILKHELVHVYEKHSVDKVFMQIVMSAFWINPFFWLAKKELTMIHEFIADKKSVENNDAAALASLILTTAYSSGRFNITSQFFQSSIKRRITMITENKDPRFSYLRRIAALFVLLTTLGMLAFRSKNVNETSVINSEKDTSINPKKVLDLDYFKDADTSTIIFTLDKQRVKYADVKDLTTDKVETVHSYTERHDGNNVIMVDLTMADPKRKGSVSLAHQSNPIYYVDGKKITEKDFNTIDPNSIESITVWKGADAVARFGDKGINGVIDIQLKKTSKPNDVKEENIIKSEVGDTVPNADAAKLLLFSQDSDAGNVVHKVSDPKVHVADVKKIPTLDVVISSEGNRVDDAVKFLNVINKEDETPHLLLTTSPLYLLDGKEITEADFKTLNVSNIESVSVWKGARAIEKFGYKAQNGVVDIKMRKPAKPIPLIP